MYPLITLLAYRTSNIMSMGGWSTDRTMKAVYRNILIPEKDKFAKLSLNHFDNMQHENKKAQ